MNNCIIVDLEASEASPLVARELLHGGFILDVCLSDGVQPAGAATVLPSAAATESSGRNEGSMARRRYQKGQVYLCGEMWYGRFREDVIRDGQTVRVRRNTPLGTRKEYPTKRLAERGMEQVLGRINATEYRPGRVATVADFAERWKVEIVSKMKPSSQKSALSHLQHHIIPRLGKMRLDAVGVENQQTFITNVAKTMRSSKSVLNILGTLSSMIGTAKKWGYICEPVNLDNLALPQRDSTQRGRTFTPEQGRQIILAAEYPYKLMYAIAAYCGLRAGEIMGLRAEDIDLERGILNITQTAWRGQIQTAKTRESENSLPIPDCLRELLRGHLPNSGLLFINKYGRPFTPERVVKKHLQPLLKKLGIPRAGFHTFRHLHTTLLLESGASPKVAQRQLRHANARTTLEIYGHVVEDSQRQAVERAAKYLN